MKYHKLAAFFVVIALISSVINPFNANGSSEKEENVVIDSEQSQSHESHNNVDKKESSDERQDNEKPHEQHSHQNNSNEQNPIPQTGPDEGDNKHPSEKDRSIEHGNSQNQGKSQSDPDGKENAHGGTSGQDKIGYDGGVDKGDQDGNNGCGNDDDFEDDNNGNCKGKNNELPSHDPKADHPGKNPGGCDVNGSTGDKNGRPCDPGKNNASENGCKHGEPDCENNEDEQDDEDDDDEDSSENENSPGTGGNTFVYVINNNQPNISNNVSTNVNVNNTNQYSQQGNAHVLSASTLAATGDSLLRFGFTLLFTGLGSLILGIYFLGRKAIEKVFNSSYQTHLYVYEA